MAGLSVGPPALTAAPSFPVPATVSQCSFPHGPGLNPRWPCPEPMLGAVRAASLHNCDRRPPGLTALDPADPVNGQVAWLWAHLSP